MNKNFKNNGKGKNYSKNDGEKQSFSKHDARRPAAKTYGSKKRTDTGAPDPTCQNPFWYAKDDAAIRDFASLPFVDVSGSQILDTRTSNVAAMIIPFVPTIPGTRNSNYATRSADAYYQSVSQGFSANFDFEAPDLLMTALASSDLFAFIGEGARAYGILNYYLQSNSLWPDNIVKGLGFDPDDLREHRREFISQYNLRVQQINSIIAVPKSFFIGERWAYLSASAFAEGNFGDYTTMYAYKHESVLEYSGFELSTGTCLKYEHVPSQLFTVDTFFAFVDQLIESLIGDDQRQMFGAIRRVYDASELRTLIPISDDIVTGIVMNEVQDIQMHNTTYLPGFKGISTIGDEGYTNDIACYQLANGAIASDYWTNGSFAHNTVSGYTIWYVERDDILLSLAGLENSPGNVLDITANILHLAEFEDQITTPDKAQRVYCRSEVCLQPYFVMTRNGSVTYNYRPSLYEDVSYEIQPEAYPALARINRAPFLIYMTEVGDDNGGRVVDYVGELDKYTTVSNEYIQNLHNKCAYNMLALPRSQKSVTR